MWLPEPVLTDAAESLPGEVVERREAVSMAFLILLQTLTPPERAVFLLREIFDFPMRRLLQSSANRLPPATRSFIAPNNILL